MSIQNNLSLQNHDNNHQHQHTNGSSKNHNQSEQSIKLSTNDDDDDDLDKSIIKLNGHPNLTNTTTTTTTTTMINNNNNNTKINGDLSMIPINDQCSATTTTTTVNNYDDNNRNGKKQPRYSIHSMTISQKSDFVNRTKKFLKGICLTILSGLFFSLTTLVVKYVKDVSPGTTAGFRYFGKTFFVIKLDGIFLIEFSFSLRHHNSIISIGIRITTAIIWLFRYIFMDCITWFGWWYQCILSLFSITLYVNGRFYYYHFIDACFCICFCKNIS